MRRTWCIFQSHYSVVYSLPWYPTQASSQVHSCHMLPLILIISAIMHLLLNGILALGCMPPLIAFCSWLLCPHLSVLSKIANKGCVTMILSKSMQTKKASALTFPSSVHNRRAYGTWLLFLSTPLPL